MAPANSETEGIAKIINLNQSTLKGQIETERNDGDVKKLVNDFDGIIQK
jgi:hypothetical protein